MAKGLNYLANSVALLGYRDREQGNFTTVAWITQVSMKPPMVLVNVAPGRYSYQKIKETGEFTLAILSEEQKEIADFCGKNSGANVDKIKELNLPVVPGEKVSAPKLTTAIANLECRLVQEIPVGDHIILVGEVVAEDVPNPAKRPLIFHQWKYLD
ncbi:flavin reductase [Carboxydothermus islandicus]|uniref:Flavin reductase n=1 Tax=Carboxydothermus islandicus TaxID=661089 RepID=A0A1L8D3C9_9THEO|nr:flavin reductase family protein [Carboxydothermus islandicus]GAV25581.1 flavin reductase [Carboxydothermus islandicus]